MYDVCIVGAGLSGSVLAERIATQHHKKVLLLDIRNHIGGNVYDYINSNHIRVNQYGAHLFHTNRQDVWEYVQQWGTWIPWEHRVLARWNSLYVPIPICLQTMQTMGFAQTIPEMKTYFERETLTFQQKSIQNSRDSCLARVGPFFYETFFRHYTVKQWNKEPEELDASVLERIPIRFQDDDRYFTDKYQALPQDGYTSIVKSMIQQPEITLHLNTDYFQEEHTLRGIQTIIFTGAIDRYYHFSGLEPLEYRSIRFEEYNVPLEENQEFILPSSVVNEPSQHIPYTRTVEYKHFLNQQTDKKVSTLVREYTNSNGEPYYPVPNIRNLALYKQYQILAEQETEKQRRQIIFAGRLANYKYINMDQAIGMALDEFAKIKYHERSI